MSDQFVAEIRIFPFNFSPTQWAFCNGQLLSISQNAALFSLLGTNYGGDGRSTFGLPNLQGNVPMHFGQGPGLSLHDLGETGGSATVTVLSSEYPQHTHLINCIDGNRVGGQVGAPSNAILVKTNRIVAAEAVIDEIGACDIGGDRTGGGVEREAVDGTCRGRGVG